jgi:hypothetical protein
MLLWVALTVYVAQLALLMLMEGSGNVIFAQYHFCAAVLTT